MPCFVLWSFLYDCCILVFSFRVEQTTVFTNVCMMKLFVFKPQVSHPLLLIIKLSSKSRVSLPNIICRSDWSECDKKPNTPTSFLCVESCVRFCPSESHILQEFVDLLLDSCYWSTWCPAASQYNDHCGITLVVVCVADPSQWSFLGVCSPCVCVYRIKTVHIWRQT